MMLFILLLVPLILAFVIKLFAKGRITFKEFLVQMAIQAVIAAASAAAVYHQNVADHEFWNGRVTKKEKEWTSCSHSYPCNCRTRCSGSGKSRSCYTSCDTCYSHSNDWDWAIYTTNNERLEIDRVDSQGSEEPPRWTTARVGEPTSLPHSYENFIKAAPGTLFRREADYSKYKTPAYPKSYDHYRLDHLVLDGVQLDETLRKGWNGDLADINADLYASKKANAIVVLTSEPSEWFYALERAWIGGKKNDVITVISVDDTGAIRWARVMSWVKDDLLKVKIRDAVTAFGTIALPADINRAIAAEIKAHYVAKPMSDFEYLKSSITPSVTQWVVTMLIGVLIAAITSVFMFHNDLFNEERSRLSYRRY